VALARRHVTKTNNGTVAAPSALPCHRALSAPVTLATLQYAPPTGGEAGQEPCECAGPVKLVADKTGTCDAVVLWVEYVLGDDSTGAVRHGFWSDEQRFQQHPSVSAHAMCSSPLS
jgi:hypothetical protein